MVILFEFMIIFMLIYMICKFRRLNKHDRVLYPFCQLRREIYKYFSEVKVNIDIDDYKDLNDLLAMDDKVIHTYNQNKSCLFNFRKFRRFIKTQFEELRETTEKMEERKFSNNPKISQLQKNFIGSLFFAFFEYTPFIKSEVAIKLMIAIIKITFKFFKIELRDYILNGCKWIKDHRNDYDDPKLLEARL
jgi:hypothetical protein